MTQHVFRPHPPNAPGPLVGPSSKHKKLQQLRSSNHISQKRKNQNPIQPPQQNQEQEGMPPIHHPTNQASISVARSVTTVTTVVPAPASCGNRTLHKQSNIPSSTANPNKTKNVNQEYRPIKIIGQGAFGVVYVARMHDGTSVAIKKVLQDPRYKNREYDILKIIDNKYCIKMLNSFKSRGNSKKRSNNKDVYLNIVMDYMPQSLHDFNISYREKKHYPPIIMAKLFTYQIFLGLSYLHSPEINITHRDMKPQNVLVDPNTGELKICDFGSAKILVPKESSVSYIASRYYRAPELMMNCSYYTNKIDIWAAGCIFAEILTAGAPLFQGSTSMGQLYEIIKIVGQPTDDDIDSIQYDLSDHDLLKIRKIEQKTTLKNSLPSYTPPEVIEFLTDVFQYNPAKRPTADQCLRHKCFDELFRGGVMMPNKKPLPPLERPA